MVVQGKVQASFAELREVSRSVSDAKLQELQHLAVRSIGIKAPARVKVLVRASRDNSLQNYICWGKRLAQLKQEIVQIVEQS